MTVAQENSITSELDQFDVSCVIFTEKIVPTIVILFESKGPTE